ncbi:TonB-dependent siderophore receptor [Methylobacterium sp. E-046]|uniref:TonB-dependent siderophore receptor n=1 Tax=Methylobacterium sp. E-046 TaxID=2836576 RepID=UPI00391B8405
MLGTPALAQDRSITLETLSVEGGAGSPIDGDVLGRSVDAISLIGPTPGFRSDRAVSATKTNTPQRDVPQVVTVVPRELITDINATRVDRAFDYVPGLTQTNNFGGLGTFAYAIRGVTTAEIYRNGLAANRGGPPPLIDTQNIERIEVLRGAGGALFGRSDPGGLVNIITKQPTTTRFVEMGGLWGSFEQFRGTVDAGGALNDEGTLLYRFNFAAGRENSYRDFVGSDRLFVAPVLSWQITPDTRLTVETSVTRNNVIVDRGVVAVNKQLGFVPVTRFLGEPRQLTRQSDEVLPVRLDHRFDADWQMRLAAQFNTGTLKGESAEGRGLLSDNRTVLRDRNYRDYSYDTAIGQAEIVGRFRTGDIGHTVLFGFDHENFDNRQLYLRSNFNAYPYAIDIYAPRYGQPLPPLTRASNTLESVSDTGFYAQDLVDLAPQWKALAGVRFDVFERFFRQRVTGINAEDTRAAASPRAGLVYQPIPEVSLYTNVSTSFRPNIGTDAGLGAQSRPFAPETGLGYEGGVKVEPFGGALVLTAAAFRIDRQNVLTADPSNSGFQIAAGGVRSQGFEFTAAGQLTPELKVIGGYTFTDAFITKDNVLPVGAPLLNIPEHSGTMLAVYEVQGGLLRGLGIGGGVRAAGERAGDAANSGFKLPPYVVADALVYYKTDNFRFGFNVENVFDTVYYTGSVSQFRVDTGSPRRFTGSLLVRF